MGPKSLSLMIRARRLRQKLFGTKLPVRESWENMPMRFDDITSFLNWFDATRSVEDCLQKAAIDWQYRFRDFPHFTRLQRRRALEIGFGGGRLLTQAAQDFNFVYAIDIHAAFAMTERFLASRGCSNVALLHRDDIGKIADGSIDFVYSFIVFQHFDGIEEVDFYLDHIDRLLSPQGIVHIYFGKNLDDGIEVIPENRFQLRDCSLLVAPSAMRQRIEKRFEVLVSQDSLCRDPATEAGESVQAMVVFRRK